jgi:hypothetical protein
MPSSTVAHQGQKASALRIRVFPVEAILDFIGLMALAVAA